MNFSRIGILSGLLICSFAQGMSFNAGDNVSIADGEHKGKAGIVEKSFALAHPGNRMTDCYAKPEVLSYLVEVPFEWEDADIEKAKFRIHPFLTPKLHGDPLVDPQSVYYVKIGALSVLAHRNWMAIAKK